MHVPSLPTELSTERSCTETFIPLDRGDSRGALVLVTHKWTFREQRDWNDKKRYPILLEDIVTDEMWHGTTQVFSGPNECYEEDKHIDLNNVAFGYVEH